MNVKIAPPIDSARMMADPLVYFGPSVLGKRYPEPMLVNQPDEQNSLSTR
jgi:hypothetical protein